MHVHLRGGGDEERIILLKVNKVKLSLPGTIIGVLHFFVKKLKAYVCHCYGSDAGVNH